MKTADNRVEVYATALDRIIAGIVRWYPLRIGNQYKCSVCKNVGLVPHFIHKDWCAYDIAVKARAHDGHGEARDDEGWR